MRCLVVFHDHGEHLLDRFLEPGFRHVFIAVQRKTCWVTVDARAGVPVVEVVALADVDLAAFYRNEGYIVVDTEQQLEAPRAPFAFANCVGMVKAVLALRSLALTPYQLYRRLNRV